MPLILHPFQQRACMHACMVDLIISYPLIWVSLHVILPDSLYIIIISTVVLIVGLGRKQQKSPLWISPKTQDTVILSLYICCPYHLWHLCEIWTELNIVQKSYKNSKTKKTTTFSSPSSHILQSDNLENCRSTGQTNGTV